MQTSQPFLAVPSNRPSTQRTLGLRRVALYSMAALLFLATRQLSAAQTFICDLNAASTSINNGFGAELPVSREFSSVIQNIPMPCLSEGITTINGIEADLTHTAAGSTTMPVTPLVRLSSLSGPPTTVITFGPEVLVQGVPVFPNFVRAPIPVFPEEVVLDLERDGIADFFVGSSLQLMSTTTQNQFVGYSRTGPLVPCFTAIDGAPLQDSCAEGDPQFRNLGVGLRVSAGRARVGSDSSYCPWDVRTNNPTVGFDFEVKLQLAAGSTCTPPASLDFVHFLDSKGDVIATFEDYPPNTVMGFPVTPEQAELWRNSEMWIQTIDGVFLNTGRILPSHAVHIDGFESGSTSAWSSTSGSP